MIITMQEKKKKRQPLETTSVRLFEVIKDNSSQLCVM